MAGFALSPEDMKALEALPSLMGEQEHLQRQLAQAQALRGRPMPQHSTGWGAALGGLGHVLGETAGGLRESALNAKLGDVRQKMGPGEALRARFDTLKTQQGLQAGDQQMAAQKAEMERKAAEAAAAEAPLGEAERFAFDTALPGVPLDAVKQGRGKELLDAIKAAAAAKSDRAGLSLRRGELEAGKKAAAAQGAAEGEEKMRKEYLGATPVKDFQVMQSAHQRIKGAPANGPGDFTRIYSMFRILDPQSVVRETEFAAMGRSGGLPGQLQGAFNQLTAQGFLSAELRQAIDAEADRLLARGRQVVDAHGKTYANLAQKRGLDPSSVVIDLGSGGGAGAVSPPSGLTAEDAQAVEWLQKNPNDPMAGALRERLQKRGVLR